jgi:hypothetical protein
MSKLSHSNPNLDDVLHAGNKHLASGIHKDLSREEIISAILRAKRMVGGEILERMGTMAIAYLDMRDEP